MNLRGQTVKEKKMGDETKKEEQEQKKDDAGTAGTSTTAGQDDKGLNEKIEKMNEQLKKVMSNFDRVNTELQKRTEERDALVKEKMSEQEKAAFELQKREDKIKEKEVEVEREKLRNVKLKMMTDNKLDARLEEYIQGTDEATMKLSVLGITKIIEEEVAKRVNEKLAGNNGHSTAGAGNGHSDAGDLAAQYEAALKRGDFVMATQLAGRVKKK
jgi:hypothetical protein